MPTRTSRLVAVVLLALVTAACGGGGDDATRAGGPEGTSPEGRPGGASAPGKTSLTVVLPNPSAINVLNLCAAQGEGYFGEAGLEVEVEAVDGSGPVLQAMAADRAQIGLPGPGPLLNARARGEDFVMFYNHFAQSVFGLVVPEGSKATTPAALKGATIGVGTAEGAEVSFARAILAQARLQEDKDYTFLPVGDGGPATAAFQRGEIEAYAAAISDMAIIEARGLALRELTPPEFLGFFGNGFATSRRFLDANATTIQGFGRALARGSEFAKANKEATIKHCGEQNPEEARDTELTAALFDTALARTTPLVGEEWGFFPPEHWERWHQTLVDSGELEKPLPDLAAAYTNQFVAAYNER